MIVNPYTPEGRSALVRVDDSNLLQDVWGIKNTTFPDTMNRLRRWTVVGLYAPLRGRRIGGIRAKMFDQKGFVTFCNQRDLEVLLDIASPGAYCPWLDEEYAEPNSAEWIGPCADEEDLIDDMFDRECEARNKYNCWEVPLPTMGYKRYVHGGYHNDFEETVELLWDVSLETNIGPDLRFETVVQRWRGTGRTEQRNRARLWNNHDQRSLLYG